MEHINREWTIKHLLENHPVFSSQIFDPKRLHLFKSILVLKIL